MTIVQCDRCKKRLPISDKHQVTVSSHRNEVSAFMDLCGECKAILKESLDRFLGGVLPA